jgi:hypothetical protein
MKIPPLACAQTETPRAKNMYAYNRQLSYPSNQSQIMKAGSFCNVENAAHTDRAVCELFCIRDNKLGHTSLQVTILTETYHVVWKMKHDGQ